jgi:DNA polymerase II small subunit/DNA polymerase delta subunit B
MAMTRGNMKKQVSTPSSKKKKKKKIPAKYLAGLSSADKAKRRKEITRNAKKSSKDPSAYAFSSDYKSDGTRRKTKESVHTKAFRKKFGTKTKKGKK